jgi:hypothetical protein
LYEYITISGSSYWVDISGPTITASTTDSIHPFLLMGA